MDLGERAGSNIARTKVGMPANVTRLDTYTHHIEISLYKPMNEGTLTFRTCTTVSTPIGMVTGHVSLPVQPYIDGADSTGLTYQGYDKHRDFLGIYPPG